MDTNKLFGLLRNRCKELFIGVFPSNRLPPKLPTKRPLLLICNTDPHNKPGQHWVAIYIGNNGTGEYFDSLAMPPLKPFVKFLTRFCNEWTTNDKQLQSVISRFCGHYCVFYSLFKRLGYSMADILNCFTSDTGLNDLMVHKFVCDSL